MDDRHVEVVEASILVGAGMDTRDYAAISRRPPDKYLDSTLFR